MAHTSPPTMKKPKDYGIMKAKYSFVFNRHLSFTLRDLFRFLLVFFNATFQNAFSFLFCPFFFSLLVVLGSKQIQKQKPTSIMKAGFRVIYFYDYPTSTIASALNAPFFKLYCTPFTSWKNSTSTA